MRPTAPAVDFAARRARLWLMGALQEEHFSTRVGAIYGLSFHLDEPEVVDALRGAERHDPSAEVRTAAALVLQEFGGTQ